MSYMNTFIMNNWRGILSAFVAITVFYSGYKELQKEVATNKRRGQNYIDEFKVEQEKVNVLQIRIAVLEERIDNCNN